MLDQIRTNVGVEQRMSFHSNAHGFDDFYTVA